MVRHECETCGRPASAVLVPLPDGEAYICVGCDNEVAPEAVLYWESLTPRDRAALGEEPDDAPDDFAEADFEDPDDAEYYSEEDLGMGSGDEEDGN
ncbi:MAG: hypothetical protein R3324_08070 [Halobacteriales archaeon]|nr:hypothetical protein [Halobacteriales archaeon]